MAQTLVGLFDSFNEADNAVSRLVDAGIPRTAIQVHACDADAMARPAVDARPATHGAARDDSPKDAHAGAMVRMEHFFRNLFGDGAPPEVGHYHEAVRRGGAVLTAAIDNDAQAASAHAVLDAAGAVDIDERVAAWKTAGYSGFDRNAPPYTSGQAAAERQKLAVVREDLEVGRRQVETGRVRVHTHLAATPVTESVTLREEHAAIGRHAVDRPAGAADMQDRFVEVRETAEEPVIAKTARVVEEVVVGKKISERIHTVNDTLRGTDVRVEQVRDDASPAGADAAPSTRKPV
jgi:uncharacterized protein (TIGR02271 family)